MYPTTHKTNNIFALLATTDDNDDDDKTTIINYQTNKDTETAYSTSIIRITNLEAIADVGATVHFVLTGRLVKNVQLASNLITINLPDGSKLRSTHTCNLDIGFIPETEKLACIVPGLAHTYLISISVLCDAG